MPLKEGRLEACKAASTSLRRRGAAGSVWRTRFRYRSASTLSAGDVLVQRESRAFWNLATQVVLENSQGLAAAQTVNPVRLSEITASAGLSGTRGRR